MKLPSRRSAISVGMVIVLAAIVAVLAVLEVRWTERVSQANRERMQADLNAKVSHFRRDFHLQLLRICWAFESPAQGFDARTLHFYAGRYDDWLSASARPSIVASVYAWNGADSLVELDPVSERFKPAPWPAQFKLLRDHVLREAAASSSAGAPPPETGRWVIDEQAHALFRAFSAAAASADTPASPRGGILIALNMPFIWRTLMPELVSRYFGGTSGGDYRVSVVSSDNPANVLYLSAPAASGAPSTGDVVEDLVAARYRDRGAAPATNVSPEGPEGSQGDEAAPPLAASRREEFLPLLTVLPNGRAWRLVVRHRAGSVEAAVESLRRRDLAVSLGVLLLLAVSIALIVIHARRVDRLARLQIDFITGVSHELRTPLAVIGSAAENLADGVVSGAGQIHKYGALISSQTRQLTQMVNQVLAFSSGRSGQQTYSMQPVEIGGLIDDSLASVGPALAAEGVNVERNIEPGLPPVLADPTALQRCLVNLVSNAAKYGGESRWVGIRAVLAHSGAGAEVRLSVEDRGRGIEAADLPHIFEPFYRGKHNGVQVHGTGLGLSIARDIARAMGARISVKSDIGRGSCFTLHLAGLTVAGAPPVETNRTHL